MTINYYYIFLKMGSFNRFYVIQSLNDSNDSHALREVIKK